MTTTMQLIAKQTVGSGGAASITFSNIPQTYTDLKLVISARTTNTQYGETIRVKPNGLSTNGSAIVFRGSGGGPSSYTYNSILATNNSLGNGATSSVFTSTEVYIPKYTSNTYKSFASESVSENNATDARQDMITSIWASTASITSLTIDNDAGSPFSFTEFSSFYLYGISDSITTQATTVPYASGGDVITTDGSYWYHAFKTSGAFTPIKDITADVLVVAGGGAGGELGGGGGGGTLAFASQELLSGTSLTCLVGAGGTAGNFAGGNGTNSQFASLTAGIGGGGGIGYGQGQSGGSGGGTGRVSAYLGAGTSGQGNNGGYSTNTGDVRTGGGGGGAGGVGGNCTQTSWASGAGGAGTNSVTNWGSLSSMLTATSLGVSSYIAGGGGGGGDDVANTWGAGGSGGGGDGGSNAHTATAGTANTGSGGGGVGVRTNSSKNGGSGLIVVRYAV
jgi:hypothetical protein